MAVMISCCMLFFSSCTQQEKPAAPDVNSVTATPDPEPFIYSDTSSARGQMAVGRHGHLQVKGNYLPNQGNV